MTLKDFLINYKAEDLFFVLALDKPSGKADCVIKILKRYERNPEITEYIYPLLNEAEMYEANRSCCINSRRLDVYDQFIPINEAQFNFLKTNHYGT